MLESLVVFYVRVVVDCVEPAFKDHGVIHEVRKVFILF